MPRETATFLGFPFDGELFSEIWIEEPDPRVTAIIDSGVMVNDTNIQQQIQGRGNLYTIPFYDTLSGKSSNYNGKTKVNKSPVTGKSQSGIVFGRSMAFTAVDFQGELSGNDPAGHIASTIGKYWNNERQRHLIGIASALFETTATDEYTTQFKETHILDTGVSIGATDINRLMVKALGDNKNNFRLALMHSHIAERLENLQVLEFWKQTLASGIQLPMQIASANGLTVVIDDTLPVNGSKYSTLLFGLGSIRNASGRVDKPSYVSYDPEYGGEETLYTKIRETMHPNGFSYIVPSSGFDESPTEEQLFAGSQWKVIYNPKSIAIAKLITDESVI